MITCPTCLGAKRGPAFADRRGPDGGLVGSCEMVNCHQCGGKGQVPDLMLIWIATGRKLREERIAREETLLLCAMRLGVKVSTICDAESGRIDPTTVFKDAVVVPGEVRP